MEAYLGEGTLGENTVNFKSDGRTKKKSERGGWGKRPR